MKDNAWLSSFDQARTTTVNRLRFLVLVQLTIVWAVGEDGFDADSYVDKYETTPDIGVVLLRFMVIAFLHIKLEPKLNASFKMMKYALNHPWKFKSWFNAYMIGLAHVCVIIGLEFGNCVLRLSDQTHV